ncbi:MAG: hypothetical protein A2W36_02460, partial [Chloroflexi bacterium RBG_16_58_14]
MEGTLKGMEEVLADSLLALEQGEGLEAVLARYPEQAGELKPLLEMAAWMGAARAAVEPRPGYVRASRARLIERIGQAQAVQPLSWWERLSGMFVGRRYATQLAVVALMLACLVLGSSGIAYASQGALPGDRLYPVKLGLEQVELLVNLDPVEEVRLHLHFSQNRLDEIEHLVAQGRYQDVHQAVLDYEYQIDQATRQLTSLAGQNPEQAGQLALEMGKILADHSILLNALIAAVPSEVAPEFVRAISITVVSDRTLQVIIIQTGVTPTPTLPVDGQLPTEASAPSTTPTPQLMQAPTGTPTLT